MLRLVTTSDGVRIACELSGEGRPVVLVHGAGSARWSFDAVRPHLEREFTVIAVDRRGRGDSGDDDDYDLRREYEHVAAVARDAGDGAVLMATRTAASWLPAPHASSRTFRGWPVRAAHGRRARGL